MSWSKGLSGVLSLILAVSVGSVCRAADTAPPGAAPRPIKFGVVNLQALLDSLDEKKDIDVELRVDAEKANDTRKSLKTEIDDLESKLSYFPLGTPDRKKKEDELAAKKREANEQVKILVEDIDKKRFKYTKSMYSKITRQVQEYAAAESYDLVLRANDEPLDEVTAGAELNYRIFERVVLYTPKSNDLTKTISELLNKKYQEEKKAQNSK